MSNKPINPALAIYLFAQGYMGADLPPPPPKYESPRQSNADARHHLEKARLKRQRRIERNKRLAEKKERV